MSHHPFLKYTSPILLVLIVLSFFTFVQPIELPFGITYTLSSIFFLLILRLYGFKVAIVINLVVQVLSLFFFEVTPWNLHSFIEIVFFAIIFRYKPKASPILLGSIFWLFYCGPISAWVYQSMFNLNNGNVLLFQVTNEIFNGVFNIFVFDMLLTYLPLQEWIVRKRSKPTFQLKKLLFHFSFIALLLPFLLYLTISGINSNESRETNLNQKAESITKQVVLEMKGWSNADILSLQLNGQIQMRYLEDMIRELAEENQYELTITGSDGLIMASTMDSAMKKEPYHWSDHTFRFLSPSFYLVIPNDSVLAVKNWGNGYYVYDSEFGVGSLNIHVEIPIRPLQNEIFSEYFNQLTFFIVLLLLAFLVSSLFYRILARSLNHLALTTTGLPTKLNQFESVIWPNSNILEVRSLITNFQHMFVNLKKMFEESNHVNEKLRNQTEMLKVSEKKLHDLAYFDSLTGLPNRQYFQKSLTKIISDAQESSKGVAILFLDLNQFKQINDTLGHMAGDELLKVVASNLTTLENGKIYPYRLSGDEFVIIMDDISNKQEVTNTAVRIKEMFQQPFIVMDHTLHISSSIGISIYPEDASEKETLIQNADIAMYSSKSHEGTSIEFFSKEMRDDYLEKVTLTNELRLAVKSNQFELYYQPKVNQMNQLTSIEALTRWWNPKVGTISPSTFIPLAEDAGLIREIDEWAINEACKQNKRWQDEGYPEIRISVNISAKHFYQSDLVEIIEKALRHSQLEAKYLQLEITESVFIENMDYVIEIIKKIRAIGVLISIDDFGKGYSSLTQLVKLPIAEVKLDKEFIRNVDLDEKKGMVVRSIVELATCLSLNVVAEGVETKDELDWLNQLGCDEMQGFLFSKPLPKDQFEKLLNSPSFFKEKIVGNEVSL